MARIGTQNGAALTLSGTITAADGVTDSGIYFRAGNNDGDFITLSGTGNQWATVSTIYSNCETGAAGVRLGTQDALPTGTSVVAGGTFASIGTSLDLNGFNQQLPGLAPSEGYLRITNLKAGTTSGAYLRHRRRLHLPSRTDQHRERIHYPLRWRRHRRLGEKGRV